MSTTIYTSNGKILINGSNNKWLKKAPLPQIGNHTIRAKFATGYTPTQGDTQTLVDRTNNIWDIYKESNEWNYLFVPSSFYQDTTFLLEVLEVNSTGVTNVTGLFRYCAALTKIPLFDTSSVTRFNSMCSNCKLLTSIPLFNTSSATNLSNAFENCYKVQTGALALYQASTSVASHSYTFSKCGRDTVTGAAELAQIPSSWGGTAT